MRPLFTLIITLTIILTGCQANLLASQDATNKPTSFLDETTIHNTIVDNINAIIAKATQTTANYKASSQIDQLTMRIELNNLRNQLIVTQEIARNLEKRTNDKLIIEKYLAPLSSNYADELKSYINTYEQWLNELAKTTNGPINYSSPAIEKSYIKFINTHNDLVNTLNGA